MQGPSFQPESESLNQCVVEPSMTEAKCQCFVCFSINTLRLLKDIVSVVQRKQLSPTPSGLLHTYFSALFFVLCLSVYSWTSWRRFLDFFSWRRIPLQAPYPASFSHLTTLFNSPATIHRSSHSSDSFPTILVRGAHINCPPPGSCSLPLISLP